MIALLQRVTNAHVEHQGQSIGHIGHGILVLLGIEDVDTFSNAKRLAERTLSYRIFADEAGKMNLNIRESNGEILVVPQFTLAADTKKGNRPSFAHAAPPNQGMHLFEAFCNAIESTGQVLKTGKFGADMQVQLTNDGPVTFWLTA